MENLRGSFAVLITPMDANQELDITALKRNIDWYVEEGVPGICILGSTGEFSSLSKEERILVTEEGLKHVNGRVKCIVGTAAETTKDTIFFTKLAQENGADAVMIINPYYCLPTEEELFAHYNAISDATDIPIMIYNNPPHTGVDMKPKTIAKLFTIKNVKYIKDASGDLRRISDFARETDNGISIFCGGEDLTLENFLLGADGWISVSGNIIPKQAKELYDLIQEDKIEEAKELFNKLYPLLYMLENGSKPIQRVKAALKMIGKDSGPARLPRIGLDKIEEEEVRNALVKIGLL